MSIIFVVLSMFLFTGISWAQDDDSGDAGGEDVEYEEESSTEQYEEEQPAEEYTEERVEEGQIAEEHTEEVHTLEPSGRGRATIIERPAILGVGVAPVVGVGVELTTESTVVKETTVIETQTDQPKKIRPRNKKPSIK